MQLSEVWRSLSGICWYIWPDSVQSGTGRTIQWKEIQH